MELQLDLSVAFQGLRLESKLGEELNCGRKVVDHDADVFHLFDRHVLAGREATCLTVACGSHRTAVIPPPMRTTSLLSIRRRLALERR